MIKGWIAMDGLLRLDERLTGYAARGQDVVGRCTDDGCRRTVRIDAARMCKRGFDKVWMRELQRTYRCNRLGGCSLDFHPDRPAIALTLGHLVGQSHIRVRLRCETRGCRFTRVKTAEEIGWRQRGETWFEDVKKWADT